MRTTCKGQRCKRTIIMARDPDGKWLPLDDRVPVYQIVDGAPGEHRAIRIPLGSAGVLHHVTCVDRNQFAATPREAQAEAPIVPVTAEDVGASRVWQREIRDPSSGEVRLEQARELDGPWTSVPETVSTEMAVAAALERAGLGESARAGILAAAFPKEGR